MKIGGSSTVPAFLVCAHLLPLVWAEISSSVNEFIKDDATTLQNTAALEANATSSSTGLLEEQEVSMLGESMISEAGYKVASPATLEAELVGSDFGEAQVVDGTYAEQIRQLLTTTREYLQTVVQVEDKYKKTKQLCRNQHAQCSFWAVIGECEANPGYMKVNCAPACQSCEMLHVETRCPVDPNAVDAFEGPGALNRMFERIVTDPALQQYEPIVLSRPQTSPLDGQQSGIWMVMFENVVTDEEATRMIELGGIEGYERSSDVGVEKADGTHTNYVNNGRTSTNAWCNNACYDDPIAKRVMEKIENITGIPETNSEYLQLLRYEEGQYYRTHSDYIPYQRQRPCGVRMLTFYIYLNDVEEGGGTDFPKLGKTVTPKKGRAVLWPSVLDADPDAKDFRADHQAMPVVKGVKYGANAWIHQRDYKTANKIGCS